MLAFFLRKITAALRKTIFLHDPKKVNRNWKLNFGSAVGFLLLQCSGGVVRHPGDLRLSVAARSCRVLIFASPLCLSVVCLFPVVVHWWIGEPSRGPGGCVFWAMVEAGGGVGVPWGRFGPPVFLYWPFQGGASVVFPYCYLFLLSVFVLWFGCCVGDVFCEFWVAEWLPIWEGAVHSVFRGCLSWAAVNLCVWLFPFWFWGQDVGSDCITSWSLLIFLLFTECSIMKHLILSPDSLWRFCPRPVREDFVPGMFMKNVDNS